MKKKSNIFFLSITGVGFLLFTFFYFTNVFAVAIVTPATGGSSISADTTSGTYTTLTGPVISEALVGEIKKGTIILDVPNGFIFDIGGTAPTVLVTRIAGTAGNKENINDAPSGTSLAITSRTTTQIIFTVTQTSAVDVKNSLTWQNVRVRPLDGTPLVSGNITKSGTSVIAGITNGTTNLGTLTEVAGAKNKLIYTTQPSVVATTNVDFSTNPVIEVQDQFGNVLVSDNTTTITEIGVLSTEECGGTQGSGVLTSIPPSGTAVVSGVRTHTALQYSFGENIKICASAVGTSPALSNAIAVSNLIPTTTSISPASKAAFDGTFTLTIHGTDFVSNSVVQFNGSDRTTAYVSTTQLTASIPLSDLTSVGTFNITVFNPALGGGTSNAQLLTVDNPLPTVASISPESKVASSTDFILTINGSNFVSSSVVRFGGSDRATVFVSSVQLTATILSNDVATNGTSSITVFNPTPGGGLSNPVLFTISDVPPPPDVTPPASISDLALSDMTTSSIKLTWTAPGDDDVVGVATSYDIRYSLSAIDDGNWESATQVTDELSPDLAGTSQNMTITGLSNGSVYFFAMKTSDGIPNASGLSNVPSGATLYGAPAAVTDLASPTVSSSSVTLTWTAPGNDGIAGTAASYDIRYSTSSITASNFDSAMQASALPFPSLAGTMETFVMHDLFPTTIYYFALTASNSTLNDSALSNIVSQTTLEASDTTPPALPPAVLSGGGGGSRYDSGETTYIPQTSRTSQTIELSGDNVINIRDWSIFLFRWGSGNEILKSTLDFNGDGKVDISDFSVLLDALRIR